MPENKYSERLPHSKFIPKKIPRPDSNPYMGDPVSGYHKNLPRPVPKFVDEQEQLTYSHPTLEPFFDVHHELSLSEIDIDVPDNKDLISANRDDEPKSTILLDSTDPALGSRDIVAITPVVESRNEPIPTNKEVELPRPVALSSHPPVERVSKDEDQTDDFSISAWRLVLIILFALPSLLFVLMVFIVEENIWGKLAMISFACGFSFPLDRYLRLKFGNKKNRNRDKGWWWKSWAVAFFYIFVLASVFIMMS